MTTLSDADRDAIASACASGALARVDASSVVYKDECAYCFDSAYSAGGVYVNAQTLFGYSRKHVELDYSRTRCALYVHVKTTRAKKARAAEAENADATPSTLGFGVDGGFASEDDQYEITTVYSLVLAPAFDDTSRVLPIEGVPENLRALCEAVSATNGFHDAEETKAWQEIREVSKYSLDLVQEDNGKKIPSDPSKWRCEETGETGNLWVNLSDGHIGSGRKHFDGSGGNGSALRHYEAMKAQGKEYPLVVKLGTISAHGADVYSYAPDEDDMVEDPFVAQHLRHWGINMMSMEKTEKNMAELQIELNKGFEFDKITEAGSQLESAYGARLVGLKNMGNTCYLNSILQVLKQVPALTERYCANAASLVSSSPADVVADFPTQMAKVMNALVTDEYASPEAENAAVAVCPRMFKQLVGKGHAEFSTGRQQDAVEYFQHLLDVMTRAERANSARLSEGPPIAEQFGFAIEDKITCVESGNVRYSSRKENVLSLEVPVGKATNKASLDAYNDRQLKRQKMEQAGEDEEPVRPEVPFSACLDAFGEAEMIDDFYSSALERKSIASKSSRIKSMPNFLAVQLRRFYVGEDWTPKKLDVLVDVPQSVSLEHLRATGLQPGEVELPANVDGNNAPPAPAPAAVQPDMTIVSALMGMGFSENGSKRAALATNNASTEVSMEWVFAHMEDADFNDPLPDPSTATAPAQDEANPESVMMLTSMGFDAAAANAALKSCSGNLERAADWLFSHSDDLQSAIAAVNNAQSSNVDADTAAAVNATFDGPGEYELFGIVSHMGGNTNCGHYVAHVKIDGKWYIFNDRKVALSQKPPTDLGYLYVFKRNDV